MVQYMEWLKAFLFGIVEGITEWLPISSTGHMILLNEFVKLDVSDAFYKMFEVVIQLGAILAVVVLFWNQIRCLLHHGRHGGASLTIDRDIIRLWCKIVVACIPAAVVGLKWNDLSEELFYNYQSVAVALIVFGVAFIAVETVWQRQAGEDQFAERANLSDRSRDRYNQLIAAIFPRTSRSGSTIVGALLLGVSRTVAAEFTFFLAIPVMFGASLLKLVKFGLVFTQTELIILAIGMVTAFVSSMLIIRMLMASRRAKHGFHKRLVSHHSRHCRARVLHARAINENSQFRDSFKIPAPSVMVQEFLCRFTGFLMSETMSSGVRWFSFATSSGS